MLVQCFGQDRLVDRSVVIERYADDVGECFAPGKFVGVVFVWADQNQWTIDTCLLTTV